MTQSDLNRAVAHSTGETVTEITRRGFMPLEDLTVDDGPAIDWDALEASRNVVAFPRRKRPAFAG